MFTTNNPLRIAVYGSEVATKGRGAGLWSSGYHGTLIAAGAEPVFLKPARGDKPWGEILAGFCGVVACGFQDATPGNLGDIESLCLWCRSHRFPLLTIDQALLAMNSAFGGLNYNDLPRELPEAAPQHRHPPEVGLRHAINVIPGTLMCQIYGEGEIVVNSEHRQAIQPPRQGIYRHRHRGSTASSKRWNIRKTAGSQSACNGNRHRHRHRGWISRFSAP